MTDTEPIIVAIELGTSRIAGIAGKHKDGNLLLLAYAEEPANGCIKRGIIYNMEKTTQALRLVITKLQTQLALRIEQVYVGLGGQSLRSVTNTVRRNLITPSYITADQMDIMADENRTATPPDSEILESIPQEYRVDDALTETPVGVQGLNIESVYLNVVARRKLNQNIDTCFNNLGLTIVERRIAPLELAAHVLSDTDKRAGCALVDIGAGTTTVVVCRNNKVRHLVTLPLGMNNVVTDLAALNIEDPKEAEQLIQKYANASLDSIDEEYETKPQSYTPPVGPPIAITEIQFAIYARLKEIIDNVVHQIASTPYCTNLLSGIVLTGGGSRVRNLDKLLTQDKNLGNVAVRTARTITDPLNKAASFPKVNLEAANLNTLLSLLASGTEGCTGPAYDAADIFASDTANRNREEARRKQTEEAQADKENLQRIETYKNQVRQRITQLNAQAEALSKYGDQKKVRQQTQSTLEEVYDMFDDAYSEFVSSIENVPQLKQALGELGDLHAELKRKGDELKHELSKAKHENSFFAKFKRSLIRIVEE